MLVLGLDIGGANLKAADTDGRSACRSFEIWKQPARLAEELKVLQGQFPRPDAFALTMTAELADCFETKAEGVDFILQAVEETAGGRPIWVWQTGAEFVPPPVAREIPLLVAAANWHALATWLGRLAPDGAALLIDVGTTTTDVIPLLRGVPVPRGLTDCERLGAGELVYSGIRRTPLCAVAHSVPLRGGYCPLAAEIFATTLDVHLVLGDIAEDPDDQATADGRPATVSAARNRMARMLCCDRTEIEADELQAMAHFLADVQKQRITGALNRVLGRLEQDCGRLLISGAGAFLAERIVQEHPRLREAAVTRLAETFDERTSQAACAFAVARLASERTASPNA